MLEDAGFVQTADVLDGLTYEKSEGGLTVGYVVAGPVTLGGGKQASTRARIGWDGAGAYVAATLSQWKEYVQSGSLAGGVACALITATLGAVACGIAALVVNREINKINLGNRGGEY